jgi:hypothetical protein
LRHLSYVLLAYKSLLSSAGESNIAELIIGR